jgi:hypothetical protein
MLVSILFVLALFVAPLTRCNSAFAMRFAIGFVAAPACIYWATTLFLTQKVPFFGAF